MSEETKDRETAEAGTGEAVSEEATDEEAQGGQQAAAGQEQAVPKTAIQPRRGTSPVSWLALFLALLTCMSWPPNSTRPMIMGSRHA